MVLLSEADLVTNLQVVDLTIQGQDLVDLIASQGLVVVEEEAMQDLVEVLDSAGPSVGLVVVLAQMEPLEMEAGMTPIIMPHRVLEAKEDSELLEVPPLEVEDPLVEEEGEVDSGKKVVAKVGESWKSCAIFPYQAEKPLLT